MRTTYIHQSLYARLSAAAVASLVSMVITVSCAAWCPFRGHHCASPVLSPSCGGTGTHGATVTIYDTPKRSATMPKRGTKKGAYW